MSPVKMMVSGGRTAREDEIEQAPQLLGFRVPTVALERDLPGDGAIGLVSS